MTDALADSLRARGPKIASRKLTVPEIEYESDGESMREGSVEPSDINSTGALSVGSGERKGSVTPPVQEEEEDEDKELKKKVSHLLCVGMTIPIPTLISHSVCLLSYSHSQSIINIVASSVTTGSCGLELEPTIAVVEGLERG